MAKKKATRRVKPDVKPSGKFPPKLQLEWTDEEGDRWVVVIRGVDFMPIGDDSDSPREDHRV